MEINIVIIKIKVEKINMNLQLIKYISWILFLKKEKKGV